MNSVFRNVRDKLIKEGKLKRYLLYALGEIILVVIGILIAIQVNNLNEERKRNNTELEIIQNVKNDLQAESRDLQNIIERRESKAASARAMAEYHSQTEVDTLKNYYSNFANVLYWEVHHPNDKTFQELINSGNLSLITNTEIKRNLLEMESQYSQIHELREHTKHDYEMFFYNEYKHIFNFATAINVWADPEGNYELSEAEVDTCLKNDAIKNGYTLAAFNNTEMGNRSREVLRIVEETITLIDEQLERSS
jgi:hypothetical protein